MPLCRCLYQFSQTRHGLQIYHICILMKSSNLQLLCKAQIHNSLLRPWSQTRCSETIKQEAKRKVLLFLFMTGITCSLDFLFKPCNPLNIKWYHIKITTRAQMVFPWIYFKYIHSFTKHSFSFKLLIFEDFRQNIQSFFWWI